MMTRSECRMDELPRKFSLDASEINAAAKNKNCYVWNFKPDTLHVSWCRISSISYLGNRRYCRLKQRCGDGVQFTIFPAHLFCTCICFNFHLVGGFNPYDKYESNWIISPIFKDKNNNKKWLKAPPSHPSIHPSIHPILTAPKRSQKESKGGP